MPNTRLRAVLNLGQKRAASLTLPPHLGEPELALDWDDDERISGLFVDFASGQLHLEASDAGVDFHFHGAHGEDIETSPWSPADTRVLVEWATLLMLDMHALCPELLDDISQAAAWHELGYDLYICEVEEPVQLDLVEVEVEGELMTLPWLGAGTVSHDHIDGDDHPIALSWTPITDGEPDLAIAEAWTDPRTGLPKTKALRGIDWEKVGLPSGEVLSWLEGIYLNHHVIPDAAGSLLSAVLRRVGGLDSEDSSPTTRR